MKELQDSISTLKLQGDALIPDNLMALKFDIPPTKLNSAATLIKNESCVQEMFKRIADRFANAFRSKKFLDRYMGEVMDEMDFTVAESSLIDLIFEYRRMQAEEEEEAYED